MFNRNTYMSQRQGCYDSTTYRNQKSPITVLEELFPNRITYTWAVARNYGCPHLFRCRVRGPNCSGEGIASSKKIAKQQAALEVLINLQKHSGNRDLENFIRNYVCRGSPRPVLCLRRTNPSALSQESFDYQRSYSSRGSSVLCLRSTNPRALSQESFDYQRSYSSIARYQDGNQRRSMFRGRCPFRGRDMDGAFPYDFPPMAVRSQTDAVQFLEEECERAGISGPQYTHRSRFRANSDLVAYASLGPYTSEGTGPTRELAKQAAAAALIDSLI